MSARRRGGDGLIVGSDFLNMFIGSKIDPSVRSRRFPLVRSDIVEPRQAHDHESEEQLTSSQQSPSESHTSRDQNRRRNSVPNERLSGLIKSQDRQNYHFEAKDSHHINNVEHHEDQQKNGEEKAMSEKSMGRLDNGELSGATEEAVIRGIMASEGKVFGGRTLPRTSSNTPTSTVTVSVTSLAEGITDNYYLSTSDASHRFSIETDELAGSEETRIDGNLNSQEDSTGETFDVNDNHDSDQVKVPSESVPPTFSISSSVKKVTASKNDYVETEKFQSKHISTTESESPPTSPNYQIHIDTSTLQDAQTIPPEEGLTSSNKYFQTSTETNQYSTDDIELSLSTVTETDLTSEKNNDWSTKLDDVLSESTIKADVEEILDGVQFQKVGIPDNRQETAVKVVSVSVSSSVAQAQASSVSQQKLDPIKKNARFNKIVEDTSKQENSQDDTQPTSNSDSALLVTEDHPPVTSVQRSELIVEESSPSEVTALPYTSYTSFHSSSFHSPSASYRYQTASEDTSSNPQTLPVSYQSRMPSSKSGRQVHFYNHPPRGNLKTSLEELQRGTGDSTSPLIGFQNAPEGNDAKRYAPLSTSGEQNTDSMFRIEPASVAESIQRSIIASQSPSRSETRIVGSRSQFHQGKNQFGRFQNINERSTFPDEKAVNEGRDRKSFSGGNFEATRYSQPQKMWGEPEKVYGEPEKVYGEPEKVYSEPEKVYGEPEKVYGEPEKVYGEPEKVYGEPEKVYGEPAKVYGEAAKNYEVDEAVSVMTNGRVHGVQPTQGTARPTTGQVDAALKMFNGKQQDPNHKFGYVVEGRNFRKYRVEERTDDGFIVGEYGVVSHDDGSLRGVRYTADSSINPTLIYDTLVKFLSL